MKEYNDVVKSAENHVREEYKNEKISKLKRVCFEEALHSISCVEKIIETLTVDKIEELKLNIEFENLMYSIAKIKANASEYE